MRWKNDAELLSCPVCVRRLTVLGHGEIKGIAHHPPITHRRAGAQPHPVFMPRPQPIQLRPLQQAGHPLCRETTETHLLMSMNANDQSLYILMLNVCILRFVRAQAL